MGLDSIELVMEWEKYFQIDIPDKDASNILAVQDAVEYISSKVTYSKLVTDIKEKVLTDFRNSVIGMGIAFSIKPSDSIFQLVPLKDVEIWKRISLETKMDMPGPLVTGFFENFIERIFPQKDNLYPTTLDRFIDLIAVVNYEKLIDRNHIQNKYEVMIAVIGITIEKIGISPFEVYLDSSFTKDLGID